MMQPFLLKWAEREVLKNINLQWLCLTLNQFEETTLPYIKHHIASTAELTSWLILFALVYRLCIENVHAM